MLVKQTNMAEQHKHDEITQDGYKKRCYCEKCVATYLEWCKQHKEKPTTTCKRKCYTVCEIECHKEQLHVKDWAFGKRYEGKWEPYQKKTHEPKHCKCGKPKKECQCKKPAKK